MDKPYSDLLRKNRVFLLKNIIPDEILHLLFSDGILTDLMLDNINSKATTFDKNVALLNYLPKRGPSAFPKFCEALKETDQEHVVEFLYSPKVAEKLRKTASSYYPPVVAEIPTDYLPHQQQPLSEIKRQNTTDIPTATAHHLPPKRLCITTLDTPVELEKGFKPQHPTTTTIDQTSINSYLCSQPLNKLLIYSEVREASSHLTGTNNPTTNNDERLLTAQDLADGPSTHDLIVRGCSHQFMDSHLSESYRMSSQPRGLALIVSIEKFEQRSGLEERKGGRVDACRLEYVLRQLGYKCYKLLDGNAKEIWTILKEFASLAEHTKCDSMNVTIMSHGHEGLFYGRDGGIIQIDEMINLFDNKKCPYLQNKPKWFILQCCRGDDPDMGTDQKDGKDSATTSSSLVHDTPDKEKQTTTSPAPCIPPTTTTTNVKKLPLHCDYFLAYATVKGYSAMRNTAEGSWFIQALVRTLARKACNTHLYDMITEVNDIVKQREGWNPQSKYHRCKEIPESQSTLCKKLFFFPGCY